MADEEDRQPPQAYDTVTPAGVGAASGNQMSPRAFQDLYLTGDQGLLDVAMEEMGPDALHEFLSNLPSPRTVAGWPDVDGAPPAQASSPAGVGSPGSQSFRSIHTTPPFSGARRLRRLLAYPGRRVLEQPRVLGVMGVDVAVDVGDVAVDVVVVVVVVVVLDVEVLVLEVLVLVVLVVLGVLVVVLVVAVAAVVVVAVVVVVVAVVGVVGDDVLDAYEDDDEIPPRRL